jgi:hypothetical protein
MGGRAEIPTLGHKQSRNEDKGRGVVSGMIQMKTGLTIFSLFVAVEVGAQSSAGTFNGLFLQSDAVENDRCGFVSLKLTPQASFSGYLLLTGKRLPFASAFESLSSSTEVTIARAGSTPLTIVLSLAAPDSLQGYVTDGTWTSSLAADRVVWDKKNVPATGHAGQYTISIDKVSGTTQPNGYGYGTVAVDSGGRVKFLGALGDGTKVTQSATVSKEGRWPFYVWAYGGKGSAIGWVPLDHATNDIAPVVWNKESGASGALYPVGFHIATRLFCSPYSPPAVGNRVMQVSNGYAVFEGSAVGFPIVNELVLSSQNKVTDAGQHKLTLKFVTKTGLFNGTVVEPGTGTKIKFAGIVFQADNLAVGNFIAHSQSGSVVIAGDSP